jgi:hypothetical protein
MARMTSGQQAADAASAANSCRSHSHAVPLCACFIDCLLLLANMVKTLQGRCCKSPAAPLLLMHLLLLLQACCCCILGLG